MVRTPATRRAVLALALVALAVHTGCTSPPGRVSNALPIPRAPVAPNIVVIVTDDQRADTLRWLPTVQRELIRQGTTFTNAFATTPTCCPSRASLLTGLLPGSTGVWRNGGLLHDEPIGGWPAFVASGMERRSLATWLTPTYETMLIGKYLNHYDHMAEDGPPEGWDVWHSFLASNGAYFDFDIVHTDGEITHHGRHARSYSTDVFADLAVGSIERTAIDQPLFLYFAPYAPHGPLTEAHRDHGAHTRMTTYRSPSLREADLSDKPPWIQELPPIDEAMLDRRRRATERALRSVDDAVRRIVASLRRTDRLSNTLIVFTSDNGSSWGEHGVPLGNKYLPYDAQTHVPLVMRWDGHVAPGVEDDRVVLNVDVPVTVADAAGVRATGVDGRSLLEPGSRAGALLAAMGSLGRHGDGLSFARPAYCAYRTARFLFVRYASGDEELYDYRSDPHELVNLVSAGVRTRVADRLRDRTRAACRPHPPGFAWG